MKLAGVTAIACLVAICASLAAAADVLRLRNGEEWIIATTSVVSVPGMSASAAVAGQFGHSTSYTTMASKVVGFRAPPGELR